MSKILVAFFSATGRTGDVAEKLSQYFAADLFEVLPQEPYTREDLNWRDANSRSSREMRDKSFRPAIKETAADLKKYHVIFLGFPVWWYVAPTVINTFLESFDTSEKKIVLFATSGGSGFGNTRELLKSSVSISAQIQEGKVFTAPGNLQDLKAWAESFLKQ